MSKHSTNTDLRFLEFRDLDYLPPFQCPDYPDDEIKKWPFDKKRAQQSAKTTGVDKDIAEYFFSYHSMETETAVSAEEQNKEYAELMEWFIAEAVRFRPIKPFVWKNKDDKHLMRFVTNYISQYGDKEWLPRVYLKNALRRSLIFVVILSCLYVGGGALGRAVDYQGMNWGWAGLCGLMLAIGLYTMSGIPGRYRLRKKFLTFMKKEGIPFD